MATEPTAQQGTRLHPLLGLSPASPRLAAFISTITLSDTSAPIAAPEVKAYTDIVYLNYRDLGFSLSFEPSGGYRPAKTASLDEILREGDNGHLACTGIDLYNHDPAVKAAAQDKGKGRARVEDRWAPFPAYPVLLSPAPPSTTPSTPKAPSLSSAPFPLEPGTTGAALLAQLGEPTRKGGGSSSTPALGIWTEWTAAGIMVEWASSGLGAWDKGGESVWRCVSVFDPGRGGAGA